VSLALLQDSGIFVLSWKLLTQFFINAHRRFFLHYLRTDDSEKKSLFKFQQAQRAVNFILHTTRKQNLALSFFLLFQLECLTTSRNAPKQTAKAIISIYARLVRGAKELSQAGCESWEALGCLPRGTKQARRLGNGAKTGPSPACQNIGQCNKAGLSGDKRIALRKRKSELQKGGVSCHSF
jgi:hypothetical protein